MGRKAKTKWRELREMRHFGRVFRFAWPHRRYLAVSAVAMVVTALCFTGTIASTYPILKVMLRNMTVRDLVNQACVQDRLGLQLIVQETTGLVGSADLKLKAEELQVSDLKKTNELYEKGLRRLDFIVGIDADQTGGYELLERLADVPTGAEVTLQIRSAVGGGAVLITARCGKTSWHWRQLRNVVYRVAPAGGREMTQEERNRRQTWMLAYVFAFVMMMALVGNVCRFVGEYFGAIVGARTLLDLRRLMYAKALMLPMGVYLTRGSSDTMSRFVRDTHDVLRALRTVFGKLMREPLKAIGVFSFALYLEPRLTLGIIVLAGAAAVLFRKFGKWIRRANEKLLVSYGRLLGALESTLTGIRVVKAYTMETRERKRYFGVERDILRYQLRIEKVNAMSSPIMETLAVFAGLGGLWALWAFSEPRDPDRLMALVVAMAVLFDPIRKLSNVYTTIQKANASSKRIFELIDTPTEFDLSEGHRPAPALKDAIVFKDVTFSYPNTDRRVVDGVDMTVRSGSVVALVGPNGSGKTTLVSLLMRLFDPQSGTILWDGVDVREFQLRSLRRRISYVSQETVMFADSIRNNIAYGKPGASQDEIEAAAKQAHADEFIDRLAEGYETMVGEHGVTLSGGERQRLAIARAILRDAPVLIFDEATSQIDAESEAKIQDAIDHFMPGRTALVIAHRFSTIGKADRIVVMDQGKIVAAGTHEELMTCSPLYGNLYTTQLRGLAKSP